MNIMPSNEAERVENLKKYKVLNTKSEPLFDQLAAVTATILNTPIAVINFIDRFKIWNGVKEDTDFDKNVELGVNLCSFAVLNESAALFENAAKEFQLISNPLIAGECGLRFHASVPITTDEGFIVGTVCVLDKKPRNFTSAEQKKLEYIALMVKQEMNKRRALHACA